MIITILVVGELHGTILSNPKYERMSIYCILYLRHFVISLFLVFIRIRWIKTGSHPYEKTMPSIELYPVFYEYKKLDLIL